VLATDSTDYDVEYITSMKVDDNAKVTLTKATGHIFTTTEVQEHELVFYLTGFSNDRIIPKDFNIRGESYDGSVYQTRLAQIQKSLDTWDYRQYLTKIER
jgi:hypothetical protein